MLQLQFGVGERRNIKNGRKKQSDLWDPTLVFVTQQLKSAPGT